MEHHPIRMDTIAVTAVSNAVWIRIWNESGNGRKARQHKVLRQFCFHVSISSI